MKKRAVYNTEFVVNKVSIKDKMFSVGDECHYNIGSDSHSCVIAKATPCKAITKEGKVFTLKENGSWTMQGYKFGFLHHGFYDYSDPSF